VKSFTYQRYTKVFSIGSRATEVVSLGSSTSGRGLHLGGSDRESDV